MSEQVQGQTRVVRAMAVFLYAVYSAVVVLGSPGLASAQEKISLSGKFEVTKTGAASYSIPIAVPPGVNGMEPKLALSYNSQAGNGLLGVGWSLSGLSSIARCSQTRAQDGESWQGGVSYGASDRFCLDGMRLVAVPTPKPDGLDSGDAGIYGADGTIYHTERESFSKVQSFGAVGTTPDSGPSYFKVWTKSGLIMEYGNTVDAKVIAVGKTSAKVWLLNKVIDANGNYMKVTYSAPDAIDGQYYPIRVDYTGNDNINQISAANKSVLFEYDPDTANNNLPKTRVDILRSYSGGAIQRTTVRLTKISTYVGSALTGYYAITYQKNADPYPTKNQLSQISSVSQCDASTACMPATKFNFGAPSTLPIPNNTSGTKYSAIFKSPVSILNLDEKTSTFNNVALYSEDGSSDVVIADFDGDGKDDILAWNNDPSKNKLFLSKGNGWFTQSTTFNLGAIKLASNDLSVGFVLGDFNGDGLIDILRWSVAPAENKILLSNGDGSFIITNYNIADISLMSQPSAPGKASKLFSTGDFNGDGLLDLIVWDEGSSTTTIYLNDTYLNKVFTRASATTAHQSGCSAMASRILADFNGDGRTDVLSTCGSAPAMYLSNGDGSFNSKPSLFPGSLAGAFVVGDFNGDHIPDVKFCGDINNNPTADTIQPRLGKGDGSADKGNVWTPCRDYLEVAGQTTVQMAAVQGKTYVNSYNRATILVGDFVGNGSGQVVTIMQSEEQRLPSNYTSNGYQCSAYITGPIYYDKNFSYVDTWDLSSQITHGYYHLDRFYTGDFDGDGKSDILRLAYDPANNKLLFSDSYAPTKIESIVEGNGHGIQITNSTPAQSLRINYTMPTSRAYDYANKGVKRIVPTWPIVVKTSRSNFYNSSEPAQTTIYSYENATVETAYGYGYLGFESVVSQDLSYGKPGLATRTEYMQVYPYYGEIAQIWRGVGGQVTVGNWYVANRNLGTTYFAYRCNDFGGGGGCSWAPGKRYFTYPSEMHSVGNHDLTSTGEAGVMIPGSKSFMEMDNWGNLLSSTKTVLDLKNSPTEFSETINNIYAPADVEKWRLNRLMRSTTTNTVP